MTASRPHIDGHLCLLWDSADTSAVCLHVWAEFPVSAATALLFLLSSFPGELLEVVAKVDLDYTISIGKHCLSIFAEQDSGLTLFSILF